MFDYTRFLICEIQNDKTFILDAYSAVNLYNTKYTIYVHNIQFANLCMQNTK